MKNQQAVCGEGYKSDSNSSGISFISQQSFERSNIANPGWSGHLQGQQSLNPSGQQSRFGKYNLIKAAMTTLQQQLQQLKQQEMLQMGHERLTQFIHLQHNRPQDNNIDFWRNFVADIFAPNAKKKWCFSNYGVPPQNGHELQCKICNLQPGRGFVANAEILPRLFQMKYESGISEELLHIEDPQAYQNSAGQIIIDYAKAAQTSVFNELHIVRKGHLRVVFSPEQKICLLDFCARRHEEFITRSSLIPKISQFSDAAQKYHACAQVQNRSTNSELLNTSNELVASAEKVAKSLEFPAISEFGLPDTYIRYLQTAEVVDSMKDLIDYSIATGSGPMESLMNFPRITSTALEQQQLQEEQQKQQ